MYKYISYISEQSHNLSENTIQEILSVSREKNSTKGITGILIYFEGIFTQFLEGPEKEIDNLYSSILVDSRHSNIKELFSGYSDYQYYSDWSMAYKKLDQEAIEGVLGYKNFDRDTFFKNSMHDNHPGIALLESFINGLHFRSA